MALLMYMKQVKPMIDRQLKLFLFSLFFLCSCTNAIITPKKTDAIYKISVDSVFEHIYDRTYETLEESKFFVVKELNIGGSLKHNKKRWGDNYNKNNFEEVRTLVLCSPWYANEVLNRNPESIAICPFSVAFLHKEGTTMIVYARRSLLAAGSPTYDIFSEIDEIIIAAIEKAVKEKMSGKAQ